MPANKPSVLSAQVILRPASGREMGGAAITAKNLAEFAPAPGAVAAAVAAFRSRGFETGPVVGVSFAVTGTVQAFESFFGARIRMGRDQAYEFVAPRQTIGHELSGEALPEALREAVHAVAFSLPPDFGPTNFNR